MPGHLGGGPGKVEKKVLSVASDLRVLSPNGVMCAATRLGGPSQYPA